MKLLKIEKVVNYLKNHTWKETANYFKISEMTISRYLKKFNEVNIINEDVMINLLKKNFNRLLRKSLYNMKANELRVIYFFLSNKSISLKKGQYITKIRKIAGVK